ncbi:MAG: hypothetical protein RIB80_10505 [Rhodospirillales bacterium]
MLNVSAPTHDLKSERVQMALALGLCLVVVLAQTLMPEYRRPVADAMGYARVIAGIADAWAMSLQDANLALGTHFGPVYPVFGALLAAADGELLQALKCVAKDGAVCDLSGLSTLFAAQGVLVALTVFFVCLTALQLMRDMRVAWLTLVIVLASKAFSNYTSLILTESITFFLLALFGWLFACILTSSSSRTGKIFGAGAALAGAALARESYIYLIYFIAVLIPGWFWLVQRQPVRDAVFAAVIFAAGVMAVLAPWWLRNYTTYDLPAVIGGYGVSVLIERLAYNAMTWREWGVSFIYWLPDFGDGLGALLFPKESWVRLTWYDPTSLYSMGRGEFYHEVKNLAAAEQNQLAFLLREYVWNDLGKHIAVTVSLAARGQWVGKYFGLVGFLFLPVCCWILSRNRRLGPFLMICMTHYFMLGLYAFVSVNVVRYNVPLIAVFAMSVATVLVYLFDRGQDSLRQSKEHS